jgi:hypothetical protein
MLTDTAAVTITSQITGITITKVSIVSPWLTQELYPQVIVLLTAAGSTWLAVPLTATLRADGFKIISDLESMQRYEDQLTLVITVNALFAVIPTCYVGLKVNITKHCAMSNTGSQTHISLRYRLIE